MGKAFLTQEQKNEIIRLYTSGEISNRHKLGSLYKTSHTKIKNILIDGGVDLSPVKDKISFTDFLNNYNLKLKDNEYFIAKCKETGKEFDDFSNTSGTLTKYLVELRSDIEIPTQWLRRVYAIENNEFWHEKYFNILIREKKTIKEIPVDEIVRLYTSKEIASTHKLGEMFKLGHKTISKILSDNGVKINNRGGQSISDLTKNIVSVGVINYEAREGEELIAVCKKTGKIFNDANNYSGILTQHILDTFGNVPIPTNTYQRKKYELEYGKKWFEEYFEIKSTSKQVVRKCKLCSWVSEDLINVSGSFTKHIENTHNLTVLEYTNLFPEESDLWNTYFHRNAKLNNSTQSIVCLECNKPFFGLTETHMRQIHGLSLDSYKAKWGDDIKIYSDVTLIKLSEQAIQHNKTYKPVFTSKPQLEIKEFLESFNLNVINNDKSALNGIELDLFVKSHNIAIEYNGLFWHTETMGKNNKYHLNKTELCKNKNIKLIHIFEDEWRNNNDIVKTRLSHIFNKDENKIYARKCIIKLIDTETKNDYLNSNHLQGQDKSKINLGAYYNGILVGVMTFSNLRVALGQINVLDTYEMVRFVNDNVIGLASKFIKYFIKNYKPKKIITYADRRWTPIAENCMYTKIGFKHIGETQPNYWYTKDYKKREHRFNYRKDILVSKGFDKNKTENEIMFERGYHKIWDCGSHKFEMVLN